MTPDGPLSLYQASVRPDWIDYNGHMNVAYYVLAFDHATDRLLDHLGLGQSYLQAESCSVFVVEAHVCYEQEVREGDRLRFETYVLGHDDKRLHFFHTMYHASEGYVAASNELLALHVDMTSRHAVPFPRGPVARMRALSALHGALPVPTQVGRVIGLRNRRPGRPAD